MGNLVESIRAKLLNVSKESHFSFQELLQRYGAEQFLARLSASSFLESFIFKGGSLLTYLIDTERQTKDLDFSIRQVSNEVGAALEVIKKILNISLEDGIIWEIPEGSILKHPEMDYPGVRIKCKFCFGQARGVVRIDMAIGDLVNARKISLERIRYHGRPLLGPDFEILAYPPEAIFAEKLQIAIKRAGQNTRMKDYYDLWKLSHLEEMDSSLLKSSIQTTFSKRETDVSAAIEFNEEIFERLQLYWAGFIRKMKIKDAPTVFKDLVKIVNQKLSGLYEK